MKATTFQSIEKNNSLLKITDNNTLHKHGLEAKKQADRADILGENIAFEKYTQLGQQINIELARRKLAQDPQPQKTFKQKALNVLDLAGDVYTAYKLSSWQCGALADLLGLDKYALSGIDYVLDMGKNYIATLLNAPKQVKELTAVVEQAKAEKEELKAVVEEKTAQIEELTAQIEEKTAQIEEKTAQVEEKTAQVEEKTAQVKEVKAETEDIQIQLAEKAKNLTKCTAEVCKVTKERNVAVRAILLVIVAAIGIPATSFVAKVYNESRKSGKFYSK